LEKKPRSDWQIEGDIDQEMKTEIDNEMCRLPVILPRPYLPGLAARACEFKQKAWPAPHLSDSTAQGGSAGVIF
jgi:hypothetical protein